MRVLSQVGFDFTLNTAIMAANSPFLGYAPSNPHMPLLAAQLDPTNITGWLAAGFNAAEVMQYIPLVYTMLAHPNLMIDLRQAALSAAHALLVSE